MERNIVFLFAMAKEATAILEQAVEHSSTKYGYAVIKECSIDDHRFYIVISGIGKAFAAAAMATIYHVIENPIVFNLGVAGTLDDSKAAILDAVISSDFVEHDLDTSAIGDLPGMISGIEKVYIEASEIAISMAKAACLAANVHCCLGRISSGDVFFDHADPRRAEVIKAFHPLSIDMESAPFAHIAYVYDIPFVSIRVISDAHNPSKEYFANLPECIRLIGEIAKKVLIS